jgi:hypothetical protein
MKNGCSPRRKNLQSEPYTYRKAIFSFALLEQLGGHDKIWGHQLVDLKEVEGETVELSFEVSGDQNCQGRSCGWSRWYSQLSAKVAHW